MKKKILPIIAIFSLLLSFYGGYFTVYPKTAKAAELSDGTWSQSGAPGTTTVVFTTSTALTSADKIILTFPATSVINAAGTNITVTGQTTPTRANNSTKNRITITLDTAITGSTEVTVTMTDGLTSYTSTTYAQESVGINTEDTNGDPHDWGLAVITNDNTTDVTAVVPLFLTMAVDDVTMDLGVLSAAAVSTVAQTYTVNSNDPSGVQVQIAADDDLDNIADGTIEINNVTDGTVTAGSEEYGISITNLSGLTADSPYDSGDDLVPNSGTTPVSPDNLVGSTTYVSSGTFDINYKASVSGSTPAGEYNQVVTITIATK